MSVKNVSNKRLKKKRKLGKKKIKTPQLLLIGFAFIILVIVFIQFSKSPEEKCVDVLVKDGEYLDDAWKDCRGVNFKCMKVLIKDGEWPDDAAKDCREVNFNCMKAMIKNGEWPDDAARICSLKR